VFREARALASGLTIVGASPGRSRREIPLSLRGTEPLSDRSLFLAHRAAPVAAVRVAVIALFVGRIDHAVAAESIATRGAIRVAAAIEAIVDAVVADLARE
jgi:hypothetical protein